MRTLLCALLLAFTAVAWADEVEVIQLRHRTADEMVPLLQPMVERGGAVTGMNNALVIRSSRANIEQLRQIVATLDRAPRRLLISVRQDAAGVVEERGAGVSGTVRSGNAGVGVNEPPRPSSGVSAGMYDNRIRAEDRVTSQVQALEGSPALINAGQTVPVQTTTVTSGWGAPIVQSTTGFQQLNSGFYVVPRIAGDRVTLEIQTQRAVPGRLGPGSANTQQIAATASGRLGEWFPLGGIDQSGPGRQSGILYGTSGVRSGTSSVWVKVDELK
jgi:hypothetical protein